MPTLAEKILSLIADRPGLTDREITKQLRGRSAPQQPVNQAARLLESRGRLIRRKRPEDGLIGNYPANSNGRLESVQPQQSGNRSKNHDVNALSEDEIKRVLNDRLQADGWQTKVAWGRTPGIDIDALRGNERWIIEVKGPGSRNPMRVNYFISILGETLQRMDAPNAKYSIALPDLKQYRGLWDRLPRLAKSRTGISLLLVSVNEKIEELES